MNTDVNFIAERWIAQHGDKTPDLVRQWAYDLRGAPTSAEFLERIAAAAEILLGKQAVKSRE